MELNEMILPQVEERLTALDIEVRSFSEVAQVEAATEEKKRLLERRAELRDLEQRRATALELTEGKVPERTIETRKGEKHMDFDQMHVTEVRATPEYRSAFYKQLMNRPLNDAEKRAALAVADIPGVIPTASSDRIFDLVRQYAPLLNEVTLLRVPGPVKFGVELTNNAAAIHTENATVTPAADAMTYVQLNAYEIVKVLRLSKTAALQSIDAFEGWLSQYLARSISKAVGNYMLYGSGSSQPKGVDNMNGGAWTDTTNAVLWTGATPTVAEVIEQVSYLKGGYHNGAVWVMSAPTFWARIASIQDNSKFNLLSPDYSRLLGYRILLDDNAKAGDVFFGNFREGMVANFGEDIRVERSAESGFLANAYDFRGSCIFDCTVPHTEGFVKGAADLTVSSV